MKKVMLVSVLSALLVCGACGKKEEKTHGTLPPAPSTGTPAPAAPAHPAPAPSAENKAPAGDKIGIPECDEYIEKYQKCLMEKVPEAQRGMMKSAFEQTVNAWKEASKNPAAKAVLGSTCKTSLEGAKQAMGALGCNF